MDLYRHSVKAAIRPNEANTAWPSTWPNLNSILKSLDENITCLQVSQVADGHKALIRFKSGYGLEIFKYFDCDFFEMTVIRFLEQGQSNYEFAFNTPIPDLSLGYTEEDIFRLCAKVSELK